MAIVADMHSEIPVYSNAISWHIKDFMCWPLRTGEYIASEWFPAFRNGDKQAEQCPDVLWQLRLCLCPSMEVAFDADWSDYIMLRLALNGESVKNVSYIGEVTYGDPQRSVITNVSCNNTNECTQGSESDVRRLFSHREMQNVLSQARGFNDMVISFQIKHPAPPTAMDIYQTAIPRNKLDHKLFSMYKEQALTDTTINTSEGDEVGVHKVVLMANSAVFEKMLTSDCVEGSSDIINMTDISREVCDIMVRFMYGENNLPDLTDETAQQLLHAAEKYDLEKLKKRCENLLSSKLTRENVVRLLVVSDIYRAGVLKLNCHRYIKVHNKQLTASGAFRTAMISHPQILWDTYEYCNKTL